MMELLPFLLLLAAFLVGLVLIPFALPGLWLMVLGLLGYAVWTDFQRVGVATLVVVGLLALFSEGMDAWLGFRFARRYGGSSRAGWGAVIGGLIGALVGVPIPLIGSILGAFVGAFIGATAMEYTRRRGMNASFRAGWGAVLGRAAAAALKVGVGLVIAVIGTYAALTA